eukprot:gene29344-2537_t
MIEKKQSPFRVQGPLIKDQIDSVGRRHGNNTVAMVTLTEAGMIGGFSYSAWNILGKWYRGEDKAQTQIYDAWLLSTMDADKKPSDSQFPFTAMNTSGQGHVLADWQRLPMPLKCQLMKELAELVFWLHQPKPYASQYGKDISGTTWDEMVAMDKIHAMTTVDRFPLDIRSLIGPASSNLCGTLPTPSPYCTSSPLVPSGPAAKLVTLLERYEKAATAVKTVLDSQRLAQVDGLKEVVQPLDVAKAMRNLQSMGVDTTKTPASCGAELRALLAALVLEPSSTEMSADVEAALKSLDAAAESEVEAERSVKMPLVEDAARSATEELSQAVNCILPKLCEIIALRPSTEELSQLCNCILPKLCEIIDLRPSTEELSQAVICILPKLCELIDIEGVFCIIIIIIIIIVIYLCAGEPRTEELSQAVICILPKLCELIDIEGEFCIIIIIIIIIVIFLCAGEPRTEELSQAVNCILPKLCELIDFEVPEELSTGLSSSQPAMAATQLASAMAAAALPQLLAEAEDKAALAALNKTGEEIVKSLVAGILTNITGAALNKTDDEVVKSLAALNKTDNEIVKSMVAGILTNITGDESYVKNAEPPVATAADIQNERNRMRKNERNRMQKNERNRMQKNERNRMQKNDCNRMRKNERNRMQKFFDGFAEIIDIINILDNGSLAAESEAALTQTSRAYSMCTLAATVKSMDMGPGVTSTLARIDVYFKEVAADIEVKAVAEQAGEGEDGGDGGDARIDAYFKEVAADIEAKAVAEQAGEGEDGGDGGDGDADESIKAAEERLKMGNDLIQGLLQEGVVLSELQTSALHKLRSLREIVDALKPSMDAAVWNRSVTSLKDLMGDDEESSREVLKKLRGDAIAIYHALQKFIETDTVTRPVVLKKFIETDTVTRPVVLKKFIETDTVTRPVVLKKFIETDAVTRPVVLKKFIETDTVTRPVVLKKFIETDTVTCPVVLKKFIETDTVTRPVMLKKFTETDTVTRPVVLKKFIETDAVTRPVVLKKFTETDTVTRPVVLKDLTLITEMVCSIKVKERRVKDLVSIKEMAWCIKVKERRDLTSIKEMVCSIKVKEKKSSSLETSIALLTSINEKAVSITQPMPGSEEAISVVYVMEEPSSPCPAAREAISVVYVMEEQVEVLEKLLPSLLQIQRLREAALKPSPPLPLPDVNVELESAWVELFDARTADQEMMDACRTAGYKLMSRGQAAVLLMAAALLMVNGVEGGDVRVTTDIGLPSTKSLLQLFGERLFKVQKLSVEAMHGVGSEVTHPLPWLIMATPETVGPGNNVVEVSPLVSYEGEGLEVLVEDREFQEAYDLDLQGFAATAGRKNNMGPWIVPVWHRLHRTGRAQAH